MGTEPIPSWRREPYRLFFPLGLLLAWWGILHWLFHAVGWLPEYRPVFHSITQVQGFLICFALGFLFTAVPRRTESAPPAAWQMIVTGLAAVGTTVAAWFRLWALSQLLWMVLVGVVLIFLVARRGRGRSGRRPPNSFVWIPIAFLMGAVGSVLIGWYGIMGEGWFRLHEFGKLLLLQGTFLGLVVGVGGMIVPLLTRGEASPDGDPVGGDARARRAHVGAALVLVLSFWIEVFVDLRAGLLLRGAVVLAILLAGAAIWRPPCLPGRHRWLVWLSAWMIPTGYLVAALFPGEKKAGLHVVFIGGFALMAFAVGLHVSLAHGGARHLVGGRPWQVPPMGLLFLAAAAFRAAADFDRERYLFWIGAAAACFLAATLLWLLLALPWWFAPPDRE